MAFLHRTALGDALEILPGLLPAHGSGDAIARAQLAVGARADAEVIAEAPVVEIVAAFAPRPRPSRGLVVDVAALGERRSDRILHPRRRILLRQLRRVAVEKRVRLDREMVERQVRRAGLERRLDIG